MTRQKRFSGALFVIAMLSSSLSFGTDLDHAATFEAMKTFVGTYDEQADASSAARVDYRLISRGSALTESWLMASGKQELTVFHMDNGTLVATHYCAAGVQSTMALTDKTDDGLYRFRLRSATNLASADASHNSGFGYRFDDNQQIFRNEIWSRAGQESESDLMLKRQ
ncbi:MAG: hypothetical protein AB8B96_19835 [Lysobacterales bacterium]